MKRFRRIAGVAVLTIVAAAYGTAAPAHADTVKTETLKGIAESAGLKLNIGTQSLSLGYAKSSADALLSTGSKTLSAVAEGAGQLLSASDVLASVPTASGLLTEIKPQACVANLPIAGILNVSLACGIGSASVENDLPLATAAGSVADIRVPGSGLLGQLLNALNVQDLTATLSGLVGGNNTASAQAVDQGLLNGLLGSLPVLGGTNGLTTLTSSLPLVNGVLDQLLGLLNNNTLSSLVPDPIVITVGSSTSLVKTALGSVTSDAASSGVDIKLLPVAAVPALANGLVHVVIGEAHTVASYDRVTGKSTASYSAANLLHLQVLGVDVPVSPNLDLNIPGILHLALGKGQTDIQSDRAGATATGAQLDLLNNLVSLHLADAASSIGGTLKTASVDAPRVLGSVEQPRDLPRTGPSAPWLPFVGVGLLALAVTGRRAVRATR